MIKRTKREMKKRDKRKEFFTGAFTLLLLFSCSFMLMPLPELMSEKTEILGIGVGCLFWIGFWGGYVCLIVSFIQWAKCRKKQGKKEKTKVIRQIISLIVTLLVMGIGVWILRVLYKSGYGSIYINYVILSVITWIWNCYFLFGSGLYKGLCSLALKEEEKGNEKTKD